MKLVSIGGCGGCPIGEAIRYISKEPSLPYDWLLTTQSFVMRSFLSQDTFIDFSDTKNVRNGTTMITKERDVMSIHDFKNYYQERDTVISRYKRRFERLNTIMCSDNPILLIRRTINTSLSNINEWREKDLLYVEKDNFKLWVEFRNKLCSKYNKQNIYILLITESLEEYKDNKHLESENVFIYYCYQDNSDDHARVNSNIYNGIVKTIKNYNMPQLLDVL